jgi:GT2 family glycosyltransferase
LPPDVSQDPRAFATWVRRREDERTRTAPAAGGTILGLVMVVADAPAPAIVRTLECLGAQTSDRWSLTTVSPESRLQEVRAVLRSSTSRRARRRVSSVAAADGASVADLLRRGIDAHGGDGVALIFPGDVWAPDAVALLSTALTPMGVVYADEDELRADGTHDAPRLKPDFSPDFLLSSSYVGRPLAIGAGLTSGIPRLVASGPAALEHECALYACEAAESVTHIAEVLCHRSGGSERAPREAVHVQEALSRRNEAASVTDGPEPGTYRVQRPATAGTTVSILIPFRDEPRLLRTCVDSITATTRGEDVELVLIDNGTSDPETLTLVERLGVRADVRVLHDARPFNWAALNNAAARAARGDVLLFLNNDIEAHRPDWLPALCAQALRPDVGAVGARLLYPDHRVQHCGLVVGLTGAAGHPLAGLPEDAPGYLHMATVTRECSAVTGACLATRREVFDQLDGFDEALGVDLNDVDFCLRAGVAGYRTIFEPAAELIHYESPSRGTAGGVGDIVHFVDRWKDYITQGDRYFNAHLTRADPSCGLAKDEEEDAWNRWYSTLTTQ